MHTTQGNWDRSRSRSADSTTVIREQQAASSKQQKKCVRVSVKSERGVIWKVLASHRTSTLFLVANIDRSGSGVCTYRCPAARLELGASGRCIQPAMTMIGSGRPNCLAGKESRRVRTQWELVGGSSKATSSGLRCTTWLDGGRPGGGG